jgi:outer membrane receptor for ferrienterochelin and colicins
MDALPLHFAHRVRPASRWLTCAAAGLLILLLAHSTALAQQGVVAGRVVDKEIGEPLTGAVVELLTGTGSVVQSATTGDDGSFRLTRIPQGSYALLISTLGYETQRIDRIGVGEEPVALGTIELVSRAFRLNPVVVTASREQEKALESPASVYTVPAEEVEQRPTATTVDHVRGLPGVDVATTGIHQTNVVARGFNNVFSGALFVLTDNRWASVPSLRFNAYNLIPTTNDDVDRIEFVLGPGSALYGPNVDKGVMHIITRSPLDYQGTTVSGVFGARGGNDEGGTEPVWQGTLRHSGLFNEDLGYKISAMYFRGTDWKFIDPVEAQNREVAIAAGADDDTLRIGRRDYLAERFTVDARVDWRLNERSSFIFAGGVSDILNSIELTGLGAAQATNWTYTYLQGRFRSGDLFAQAYINFSNAGDSYTLRDGNRITDNSFLYVGQVQHATDLGERQRFVYGADLIRTVPRTDETIHGQNEYSDNITEIGGYVQSETRLSPQFDLVLAGRLDHHSMVEDVVFSPRAALVFKPTPEHNLRFTYNRAFSQPTSVNLNLDLYSSPSLGPFADFGVRAIGVPSETGLTFRRDCEGRLCMRSPFAEDSSEPLAPDVTPYWNDAVSGFENLLKTESLTGILPGDTLPAALEAVLRNLEPTGQDINTVYKMFDIENEQFGRILSDAEAAFDVAPLVPNITNTIEFGYKGLLSDRLLIGLDLYYQRVEDFIGPLRFETPNAFLDPRDLSTFLRDTLTAVGVPAELQTAIIAGLANVPLATATFEQAPEGHATDLYVTYRNFGEVDIWGADLGLTFLLTDEFSLSGSYSFASENFWRNLDNIGDVALNAPKHKGMLDLTWRSPRIGLGVELRGRYTDSYPVTSGVFAGDIPSFTVFDANITYVLPVATAPELSLSATNIFTCVGDVDNGDGIVEGGCGFDEKHREMIGAPFLSRMVLLRLRQAF